MFTRRFVLLAGVLVALNLALWFAAPGLALRRGLVNELFGPRMIRAEVHERNGQDWNLDRGVITQVDSTQLTLREADGRIQAIPLAVGTTRVIRFGRRLPLSALSLRWRVVVTWPPIGPAQSVDVERIPRRRR
ncbi:MAG TPA: hypothetical protein VJ716_06330 [Gaiellaceae bacterium]|nr:hypothetical protein [Gaiellaceae bacterium]